jgi:hypothetical protein
MINRIYSSDFSFVYHILKKKYYEIQKSYRRYATFLSINCSIINRHVPRLRGAAGKKMSGRAVFEKFLRLWLDEDC